MTLSQMALSQVTIYRENDQDSPKEQRIVRLCCFYLIRIASTSDLLGSENIVNNISYIIGTTTITRYYYTIGEAIHYQGLPSASQGGNDQMMSHDP